MRAPRPTAFIRGMIIGYVTVLPTGRGESSALLLDLAVLEEPEEFFPLPEGIGDGPASSRFVRSQQPVPSQ